MNCKLENWCTVKEQHGWMAPEIIPLCLKGIVTGHPQKKDGTNVTTSGIVHADKNIIETRSGTVYELGTPNPEWIQWMKDNNVEFDINNPVRKVD